MLGTLRYTAIVLGLLVFAAVLSVCGESFACAACVQACCVSTDHRTDRSRDVLARVISSASGCATRARPVIAAIGLPGAARPDGSAPPPSLLAPKVAALRI